MLLYSNKLKILNVISPDPGHIKKNPAEKPAGLRFQ